MGLEKGAVTLSVFKYVNCGPFSGFCAGIRNGFVLYADVLFALYIQIEGFAFSLKSLVFFLYQFIPKDRSV